MLLRERLGSVHLAIVRVVGWDIVKLGEDEK